MVTRVVVLRGVSSQRRPWWAHGYNGWGVGKCIISEVPLLVTWLQGLGVGKCIISEAPPGGYLVTRVGVLA